MPHNRVSELQLDDPPDSWLWYSLLCTWAWPGLRSAVEAAASGHELSSGSGCDGVMASTWAQSQLRLRAQSHDTRARAHWPGPCKAHWDHVSPDTWGAHVLCANIATSEPQSWVRRQPVTKSKTVSF